MYAQAPPNVFVIPTYTSNGFVVRWDNPFVVPANTSLPIVGVNLYRSFGSDDVGFEKINATPIQGLSYVDVPESVEVQEAPISVANADVEDCFPVLQVAHIPIVGQGTTKPLYGKAGVAVAIDGHTMRVKNIDGQTGVITLDNRQLWNPETRDTTQPVPILPGSEILVTYSYSSNLILGMIRQPVHYKVVSVLAGGEETPRDTVKARTYLNTDTLPYYWREAINRNSWMLYQGGERVKLYTRKWMGVPCGYRVEDVVEAALKSHAKNCPRCFGTGFEGGYFGPHDILIAPPDSEHPNERGERGYTDNFVQSTWTGPEPIISQRDLIVKQTGERFLVGPVGHITCPGHILQQEFSYQPIDRSDVLYTYPLEGVDEVPSIEVAWPQITNKDTWDNDQPRGRTEVFVETTLGAEGSFPTEHLRKR